MSMPGWAIALGALNEAPKVASNWMGLFKGVQDLRDQSNTGDALRQLDQFKTSQESDAYQPQGYVSPESYQTLRKLRAERTGELLRREAAGPLGRIAALRDDPAYQTPETLAEINKNPAQAVFGHGAQPGSGIVPGATKGSVPTSAPGANPYVAQALQEYQTAIQNRINRFSASNGDRWAGAALEDKQANAFKDVATGQKDYAKLDSDAKEAIAKEGLNQVVANYPLDRNVQSWNGLVQKLRRIPGIEPSLVDSTLKDIASRNQAPVGGPLTQFVKNGPNSTKSEINVDMFGEPISSTRITSTNNPSDREMGLVGGGAPQRDRLAVTQAEDGTIQVINLDKGKVEQARGADGNPVKKYVKPDKKRSFGLGARPGGAAAPRGKGGFTYINGKLVAN